MRAERIPTGAAAVPRVCLRRLAIMHAQSQLPQQQYGFDEHAPLS